jgi:hypothetical protein
MWTYDFGENKKGGGKGVREESGVLKSQIAVSDALDRMLRLTKHLLVAY